MPGNEVGSIYYDLNIDDKNLKSQLNQADQAVKGFGQRINKYWGDSVNASKKVLLGFTAAAGAAVAFGVSSVKAYNESQEVLAQTRAVLQSTGRAAGVTENQVRSLASSFQSFTRFSDEQIQSGENLLLTFTKIGKDVFPQATETMLDMSQALGQDIKNSAIQLGKALQDPILGVTALRRVGVNFSEKQKEVIQKLVETGKSAQAQRLILKELHTEFGNSARAAGQTFSGQLDILKNSFGDLQEGVGQLLVFAIFPLTQIFAQWITKVNEAGGLVKYLTDQFNKNRDAIILVAGAIAGVLVPAVLSLAGSFAAFLLVIAPWALLGAGIVLLFQKLGISFNDVVNAGKGVIEVLKVVWQWIGQVASLFMALFWPSIKALAAAIWQDLWPALLQLWDAVVRLWRAVNPALMQALKFLAIFLGVTLIGAIFIAINALRIVVKVLAAAASAVSNLIKWISNLISWLGTAAVAMVRFFRDLPGKIGRALSGVGRVIIAPFKAAFDWIREQIHNIAGLLGSIKDTVSSIIGAPGKALKGAGRLLEKIPGFAQGGIVPGPIGAPRLAVVHGGESITPVNKRGNEGPVFHIGQINNQQDENWVIRHIDRNFQLESMGLSPIR